MAPCPRPRDTKAKAMAAAPVALKTEKKTMQKQQPPSLSRRQTIPQEKHLSWMELWTLCNLSRLVSRSCRWRNSLHHNNKQQYYRHTASKLDVRRPRCLLRVAWSSATCLCWTIYWTIMLRKSWDASRMWELLYCSWHPCYFATSASPTKEPHSWWHARRSLSWRLLPLLVVASYGTCTVQSAHPAHF